MADQHLLQPLDITSYWAIHDGQLTWTRRNVDPEDECFVKIPLEFPAYMRVLRILKAETEPVTRQHEVPGRVTVGVTMELNFTGLGVKVYLRYGRDGTLRIITEDGDGREVLAKYERNTDT